MDLEEMDEQCVVRDAMIPGIIFYTIDNTTMGSISTYYCV